MSSKTKKVLFTATVDSHILAFHTPYLKMFKEKGYEVHVATNGDADIPYCDVKHIIPFERNPIKTNNIKAIFKLKKIVEAENYSIIHTHTPMGSFVTRLAAMVARKRGTRVIYTAHGFHFFKGVPILNWLIYYPIERLMAKITDTLITINNEDYEIAKSKFKTDVQYVPGVGIDPKKFDIKMTKQQKIDLRKSLGLKDSDFVMIYPAELNKNKNQKMLIDIMEILEKTHKDVHLLLPGKDSMNGYHQKLVAEKNLNNIHFLGYRNDIPQLMKISNLAVSTSLREGLPVNIIEAIYIGLPVIATNCRGNRDLINDKSSHLIEISDNKGFIDSITFFTNKSQDKNKVGDKDRKIGANYILNNVLDMIIKIYDIDEKRKTKDYSKRCLFVHDFKYIQYGSTIYGDGQFGYENLWKKKYLNLFKSVTVVARGSVTNTKADISNKYKLNGDMVHFIPMDSLKSWRRLLNTFNIRKILDREVSCTDMAIVRLPSIQGLIACNVLAKSNKPYMLEVVGNGFDSLWYHDTIKGKIVAPIVHIITRHYIKKAPNVIYVTNKYLQKVYPNTQNNIACSDVVIEDRSVSILERRIKKIYGHDNESIFKIGLVGSYDVMYKGHDVSIKAISELVNVHKLELHFLGSGSQKKWIDMAQKLHISSNVYFDSPLSSGGEMFNWLDNIDILLVPSKTEGMPRIILESMSRAGVIIATDVGDIPYILNKDNIIDKSDWKGLATKIDNLLSSKDLMAESARDNFLKADNFCVSRLYAKRNDLINNIISDGEIL